MRRVRTHRVAAGGVVLAALLVLLATPALAADAEEATASIAATELAKRIEAGDAPLVLDVRTPKEYAAGHIPGAVNIPYDELDGRLDELPKERGAEIVVHCHSGKRAGVAEGVLHEAGYTEVKDLTGHWQGWREADHPTEK